MKHYDVIIIGAGPYGLSAAAHLKRIDGLNIRVLPADWRAIYVEAGYGLL
jgi:2-polyprenyl-6-methoxyphenol hydroxylase-like FAD-dependent oxidoreductase